MAYNTGNAIGSTDARDLYDNAQNLDKAMNSTDPTWTDRFGVARPTFKGAESELNQKVGDAEAAAAQALGYMNTMRATSYGPLTEDPTTDPLGNPCTAGDEYFNTTYNLLKRFDGSIWRVPDINTENLASGAGSSMVGHGGQTVEAALNERLPEIGTYALLRAYTGPVTAYYVRGVANIFDGGAGVFRVDAADTTSADNGGTILVDASGRRWKREFSGPAYLKWFGATGAGVVDDWSATQSAALFAARTGTKLLADAGTYNLSQSVRITPADLGVANRGVTIEGNGAYFGVRFNFSGSGYAFEFAGSGAEGGQPITRFQIKNIYVTGSNNTVSEGGFLFERCYVVRMEDCSSVSWAKSTAHAVQIRNVFNFEVSGGNYANGFPDGQGSHVFRIGSKSPDAWNTSNVIIRNTLIQRGGGYGVFVDQEVNIFDNFLIDNVSFGSNMLGSVYADTTLLNNLTIKNCHFESAGKQPDNTLANVRHVYVRGASCVEIANNSFQDAKWHAHLENINSFVFENNKIFETGVYTIASSVGLTCVNARGSVGANRIDTAQIDTMYSFDTASRVALGILDTTEAGWFPTIFNAPATYRNAIVNRRERARVFDMLAVAPDGANWRTLNMSTRSVSWANTMPTSGSYTRGDVVYNEDTSILGTAGSRYHLLGWRRITTGSNHVLDTDWVQMRTLTGT